MAEAPRKNLKAERHLRKLEATVVKLNQRVEGLERFIKDELNTSIGKIMEELFRNKFDFEIAEETTDDKLRKLIESNVGGESGGT